MFAELSDTLETRPYLVQRIPSAERRAFLAGLIDVGAALPPLLGPYATTTRDPDDDYLLAYARRDRADFLVTGDRDLLAPEFAEPRILDPGAFVRELRDRGLVDA